MEETTETKFATDEIRVQLANDVLAQIAKGNLIGTPEGSWFIGFEYELAANVYKELALNLSDEGEDSFSRYNAEDADEDTDEESADPRHGMPYLTIGSRETQLQRIVCDTVLGLDLQEFLQRAGGKCCVCGIGSLVVAAAARYDNMKIDLLEKKGVFYAMKEYFSSEQLRLIEIVYECGDYDCELKYDDRIRAVNMWPSVPSGTHRLRLIMENIVANNGIFVVP